MSEIRILGILAVLFVFSLGLSSQDLEPLQESVSVVNVEVPVRVFLEGRSVPGLSEDDFQIFEDGKPQIINGFYMVRKKMDEAPAAADQAGGTPRTTGRYFVLVFRTYEFNDPLKTGIGYLFSDVLRPDDQVLIMANNKALFIDRVADGRQAQDKVIELVKSESRLAAAIMFGYQERIEQILSNFRFQFSSSDFKESGPDYVFRFLQSYQETWREFKRRYLLPDLSKYYYFARHLERVKREKWVLNFFQLEQFPKFAFSSEIRRDIENFIDSLTEIGGSRGTLAKILKKMLHAIDMDMNVADDFPSEEVSKMFYKVNATFHSFFISVFKETGNPDLQFRNVATDIENSLRQITDKTGGSLLVSNDLVRSLQTVEKKEDLLYMLTYEPGNAKKVGKIKVTVKDKECKVLYDDNIRADYIREYLQKKEAENPAVMIKNPTLENRQLAFTIERFSLGQVDGENMGMLHVRIRVRNASEQNLFDESKAMKTFKPSIHMVLDLDFLVAGKYDIIIDVLDQVSGKTCTEVIQPIVR